MYIGRQGSQIEVWDIRTGEKTAEYSDMNWPVQELYPDPETGRLLCIGKSTAAVLDLSRMTVFADRGVTDLKTESVAVSPDDRFMIVTTPSSDGNIYRLEIPGMHPRVIVNGDGGVFNYKEVQIACDAAHFGAVKRHNEWFVFDSGTGALAGEMKAVDVDDTGVIDAQWIRGPRFLPQQLSLGKRNLTILYHQNGCFVLKDPDEPEKTRVIRAFKGSIGWNQLFDSGEKLAAFSSTTVREFDLSTGKLKYKEDPSLDDGAKIIELKTGECLEHTEDWARVYITSEELDHWPAIQKGLEKLCSGLYQGQKNFSPFVRFLCKAGDCLLYSRSEQGNNAFSVISSVTMNTWIIIP